MCDEEGRVGALKEKVVRMGGAGKCFLVTGPPVSFLLSFKN